MVESVSFTSIMSSTTSVSTTAQGQSGGLTYAQQEVINSTLSNLDPDNLTQSDAKNIVATFEEAGIRPSKELESAMSELGFDAREVGDLAGVGKPQGGGGPGMMPPPVSEEEESYISELLESLLDSSSEDSSLSSLMDYTSKILNLNDTSKTEVMDILDQYQNSENDYTQEQINTLLKSSLDDILSNSDNFNRLSVYG
jgi:hypothetical protein